MFKHLWVSVWLHEAIILSLLYALHFEAHSCFLSTVHGFLSDPILIKNLSCLFPIISYLNTRIPFCFLVQFMICIIRISINYININIS